MTDNLSVQLVADFVRTHPHRKFYFRLNDSSMDPTLKHGERLTLRGEIEKDFVEGDIVLANIEGGLHVSRILMRRGDYFLLKGDAMRKPAPPVELQQILGKVVAHEPYPWRKWFWNRVKNRLVRWLSTQLCEMVLESQSHDN